MRSSRKTQVLRNDSDDCLEDISFGDIDDYSLGRRLGRGKYSNVFKGFLGNREPCVVKVLKPVRIAKIRNEISILLDMRGAPHTAQLLDIVHDPESDSISLILDWSENQPIKDILGMMTTADIAHYVKCVLEALVYAHSKGIMHRDVKPGNIMYDFDTKTVKLIDWGLAEYYRPGTEYPVRVATRHYKGPELLLNYQRYGPSLDIWCLGCTLASLLFARVPFFRGHDNDEQIVTMAKVLGGDKIMNYVKKYELSVSKDVAMQVSNAKAKPWSKWIDKKRKVVTPEALDLLEKMLTVDHEMRPTAEEALKHPFFDCLQKE